MEMLEAIQSRRSIRRFRQEKLAPEAIDIMLDAARFAPTGSNMQPLRFIAVVDEPLVRRVFPHTRWAGAIPDGSAGPTPDTQPVAYIAILVNKAIRKEADTDAGAAGMSILLAAQAQGIASCWLGAIDRAKILALLGVDEEAFALHTVVALGYPAMTSRAVQAADGDIRYYLEAEGALCVPKRPRDEVVCVR